MPRVQQDIISTLQLSQPYLSKQSFDRDNLIISVQKKTPGGIQPTLGPLIPKLSTPANTNTTTSTILYAPTKNAVDNIATYLKQQLGDHAVGSYHAGMTPQKRSEAHTDFLIGKTSVICATVAFGMGIDKPDTRRVIHYGPPKTMEEYYQQIGRAGRDGLRAECYMFISDGDFDRYNTDFYMGGLKGTAKNATLQSLNTLKRFSYDMETCRRRALLEYFHEVPSFGQRCGACDVCAHLEKHGTDSQRDLAKHGARIVLQAIRALNEPTIGFIEKIIGGKIVEEYRYRRGEDPLAVQKHILAARKDIGKRRSVAYFREFVPSLVNKGYVSETTKKFKVGAFDKAFTGYNLTNKGWRTLKNTSEPIILPVTQTILDIEQQEEERRQKALVRLEKAGVQMAHIPKDEIEFGDGEAIQAFTKWHNYLDGLQRNDQNERISQLEDLRSRVEAWRMDTASKYRMAPVAVLAEHVIVLIAYTVASMKPGIKVEEEALLAAGVRSKGVDRLVLVLNEWVDAEQPAVVTTAGVGTSQSYRMVFGDEPFQPSSPWEFAVYKPNKKSGVASWESSHERFLAGEHPQAIAMSPTNGKPIQLATVVGHILEGLSQGRAVPLKRLDAVLPAPNKSDWDQLAKAESQQGIDVRGDPSCSGKNGDKFTLTELLHPIMGDQFIATPYNERTDEQKSKFIYWCEIGRWYINLRRVGYAPRFIE